MENCQFRKHQSWWPCKLHATFAVGKKTYVDFNEAVKRHGWWRLLKGALPVKPRHLLSQQLVSSSNSLVILTVILHHLSCTALSSECLNLYDQASIS